MVIVFQRLEYWVVSPGMRFQDPSITLMEKSTWKLTNEEIQVLLDGLQKVDRSKLSEPESDIVYNLVIRFEKALNK